MEVELDGRTLALDDVDVRTVGELAERIRDRLAAEGRVLTALTMDGQGVSLADTGPWGGRALGEPGCFSMCSANTRDLCAQVLREGAGLLLRLAQAQTDTADLLRQGKLAEGNQLLGQWLPLWGRLQEGVCKASALCGWDLADTTVGSDNAQALIDALAPLLQQLRDALREQDFVSVADLLEYEAGPLAGRWETMCIQLDRRLADQTP